ncbi:hypothetical protein [Streptomyces rubrogriseus]|uniref:hypothetical protein n=1 Tax=Streptomyces rubrogriseus TaxID=194673 RepID=UPI0037949CAD
MPKPTEVDQDAVVRARNILLASGRRTPREEVDACRVLARVSPAAYLPRLARALQNLSCDRVYSDRPEDRLALREEAVAAARALDPADPKYADVLYDALDGCQLALYTLGRRDEGLAVRAEMLSVGRTRAESSGDGEVWGLFPWATGLLEEGRHAEAVDVLSESVTRGRRHGPREGVLAWTFLAWIAALDAAGRSDEALTAMAELLAVQAAEAAKDGMRACRLHLLIRYAQMLDDALRHAEATAVRQEALALFEELAVHGEEEARRWSGYQAAFWAVLFFMSVAGSERPAAGQPRPPVGTGSSSARRTARTAWRNRSGCTGCSPCAGPSPGSATRHACANCSTRVWPWPGACADRTPQPGAWPWPRPCRAEPPFWWPPRSSPRPSRTSGRPRDSTGAPFKWPAGWARMQA